MIDLSPRSYLSILRVVKIIYIKTGDPLGLGLSLFRIRLVHLKRRREIMVNKKKKNTPYLVEDFKG